MDNFLINPFFGVGAIKGFENINLETGEYVWEAELSEKICFDYPVTPTGIDSLFFFCGIAKEDIPNGLYENAVFCGNIYNGACRKLCEPIQQHPRFLKYGGNQFQYDEAYSNTQEC